MASIWPVSIACTQSFEPPVISMNSTSVSHWSPSSPSMYLASASFTWPARPPPTFLPRRSSPEVIPALAIMISGWAPRLMLTILAPPTLSKTPLSIPSKSTSESNKAIWY